MYSIDVTFTGAPTPVPLTLGAGLPAAVGFRVIPVLGVGALPTDLAAAYENLRMLVTKQTVGFPGGTSEQLAIAGADWVAGPGMGALTIQNGLALQVYRVWVATDCKEMTFVAQPAYPGFSAPAVAVGTGNAPTRTNMPGLLLTAAPPVSITEFVPCQAALGVRLTAAAPASNTFLPGGAIEAYRWDNVLSVPVRFKDLDFQQSAGGFRYVGWASFPVADGIAFLCWKPNGLLLSGAGTTVDLLYEVSR